MTTKEEVYIYLDYLRDSGICNMFGAGSYIEDQFKLTEDVAKTFLLGWMKEVENGTWDMETHTGQVFE
jgi:hypothetical protein